MSRLSEQTEWLSLVDITGPFLVEKVLEEAFPQGLDKVETPRKQHVRAAYEEWVDAVDENDPDLGELHSAWVRLVLEEALELDDEVLFPQAELGTEISYRSEEHGQVFSPDFVVCDAEEKNRLLVSFFSPGTALEEPLPKDSWVASPSERMTLLCRHLGVRLGLITNGEQWMLINAPLEKTSAYTSWYARIWWQEPVTFKAFVSLLGVRRFFGHQDQTLESLLERSLEAHEEVTATLGEQVRRAVEILIQALGRADEDRNGALLADVDEATLYEAGLIVMMRLVFLLCAEERELLLLGEPIYDQHYAVSTLRAQLREDADRHGVEVLERRHDAWSRLLTVFRAVYAGVEHDSMRMPALGGSLFDPDRFPFLEGRGLETNWKEVDASPLPIDNRTVLLLMKALQVLEQKRGARTLSYRALDVEQIGHVYEGLLDYQAKRVTEVSLGLIGSSKVPSPVVTLRELRELANSPSSGASEMKSKTGRSKSVFEKVFSSEVVDERELSSLVVACRGDEKLARDVLPFVKLLEKDSWGAYLVYPRHSFIVQQGLERRKSGAHYTPKSLSETVVEQTLTPLVYHGVVEGTPRAKWLLKSPSEILSLKICDPAMGSGAFLVESCRFLASRLTESWRQCESVGEKITIDGLPSQPDCVGWELMPDENDVRQVVAKRLIAERCIYGVDINPVAVELAKLSIWLITMSKGRPLGFLDHHLRCGDSLLGIYNIEQLHFLSLQVGKVQQRYIFGDKIVPAIESAMQLRERIGEINIKDMSDVKCIENLNDEALEELSVANLISNMFIGSVLDWEGGSKDTLQSRMTILASEANACLDGSLETLDKLSRASKQYFQSSNANGKIHLKPFHWPLEFPEVFMRNQSGFDGIVGNPPFLGNKYWREMIHEKMHWQANMVLGESPVKNDLSLVFHRRANDLLRSSGCYGLLATSSISEGSAVPLGLGKIIKEGSFIAAQKNYKWPGKAQVSASTICYFKGAYDGERLLNGKISSHITARLSEHESEGWIPQKVPCPMFRFVGVNNVAGAAFLVVPEDEWFSKLQNETNSLLRPYITGDDITTYALQSINRYALDLGELNLETIEKKNPIAHEFLLEVVLEERTEELLIKYKGLSNRWWQFWRTRAKQFERLRKNPNCIVFSKVTKHPFCMLAPTDYIFTNQVLLVGLERPDMLALCLSCFFSEWIVYRQGAKFGVGSTLRLSAKEAFDSFPLPNKILGDETVNLALEIDSLLRSWSSRKEKGLTDFVNELGRVGCTDEEILSTRSLLLQLDLAVAEAYNYDSHMEQRTFLPAHYVAAEDIAFIVPPSIRQNIIEFLTQKNREQCESKLTHSASGNAKKNDAQGELF